MATFADRAGEVGHLAAAALQTAGYSAQSRMLDEFNGAMGTHLAGLLYLIAIISALVIMASGGSYRYGLWLLVGPPIFYLLISERMSVKNAQWRFGDRLHPDGPVLRAAAGLTNGDASVSTFFAFWDDFSSGLIQELIGLLDLTQRDGDLLFLRQSDRFHETYNLRVDDRNMKLFLRRAVFNRCSGYFHLARQAADPEAPEYQRSIAEQALQRHMGHTRTAFAVSDNLWMIQWWEDVLSQGADDAISELAPSAGIVYSCPEVWRFAIYALKKTQATTMSAIICSTLQPNGLNHQSCMNRLAQRFGTEVNAGNVLRGGAGNIASNNGGNLVPSEGQSESETAAAQQAIDDANMNYFINELAARMLFRDLYTQNRATAQVDLSSAPDFRAARVLGQAAYSDGTAQAIREISMGEEYTARGEIIAAAINMPYFQGMILFFLAWSFPYFALMAVVPGRESVVLLWMSLWFWVKLWDLGFAVVIMIDNMLYALLPHGEPMTAEMVDDPGRALNTLFQADPMYSAYTYYTLISACIFSVPVITGLLVKKGGGELVAAVSQALRDFPADFGRAMGGRRRSELANQDFGRAQRYIYNRGRAAMWDSVLNSREVLMPLLENAALEIARSTWGQGNQRLQSAIGAFRRNPNAGTRNALLGALTSLGASESQAVIDSLMSQAISTQQRSAMATATYNMNMAAYTASTDDYVKDLAMRSVQRRWNSHDYRRTHPGSMMLARMQAETEPFMWQGGMWDAMAAEAHRFEQSDLLQILQPR